MSTASVAKAKQALEEEKVFPAGCTGLLAYCMGNKQKHTSEWTQGEAVDEGDLSEGDVVGWGPKKAGESGHVAIYVGEANAKYIDCPGPGKATRALKNGYGAQQLYRMKY